jgi:hypothetical protein
MIRVPELKDLKPLKRPATWSRSKSYLWWVGVFAAFLWAIPWTVLTVALVASIVGIWLAPLPWAIGCLPCATLIESRVRANTPD